MLFINHLTRAALLAFVVAMVSECASFGLFAAWETYIPHPPQPPLQGDPVPIGLYVICEGGVAVLSVLAAASITPTYRSIICWIITLSFLLGFGALVLFLIPFLKGDDVDDILHRMIRNPILLSLTAGGLCGASYVTLRNGKPLFPRKPVHQA